MMSEGLMLFVNIMQLVFLIIVIVMIIHLLADVKRVRWLEEGYKIRADLWRSQFARIESRVKACEDALKDLRNTMQARLSAELKDGFDRIEAKSKFEDANEIIKGAER